MRVVVYDDEDMEPITVLNLKGITMRDLEQRGFRWRVPVPETFRISPKQADNPANLQRMQIVDLEFEPLRRRTRDGREQESIICFAKAAELAMLLNPDWLPGQRPAVNYLMEQNDRLTDTLMKFMMGMGR